MGWQWHQLNHVQAICTSLQKITTPAPHQSDFTGRIHPTNSVKALKAINSVCCSSLISVHWMNVTFKYELSLSWLIIFHNKGAQAPLWCATDVIVLVVICYLLSCPFASHLLSRWTAMAKWNMSSYCKICHFLSKTDVKIGIFLVNNSSLPRGELSLYGIGGSIKKPSFDVTLIIIVTFPPMNLNFNHNLDLSWSR